MPWPLSSDEFRDTDQDKKILSYALSIRTIPPLLNLEKIAGSPRTLPTTLTELAGLISFLDLLAGVEPQKIHIAVVRHISTINSCE